MLVEQPKQIITPLLLDSYITVIKNSIGSDLFRTLYATVDGEKKDILQNGQTSCAFFVSSILVVFKLIKEIHATVNSTVKDLQNSDWIIMEKPKIGSILIWEKVDFGKEGIHNHIGFFVGNGKAISNSEKLGHPIEHSWDFDGKRKVDLILWNSKLNQTDPISNYALR